MSSSTKIITLQNIDDEDFAFSYNASEGNPPYLMKAGGVVRYPEFLAKHALKHLIDKILTKQGERSNNRTLRLELADKIVIDTEKLTRQTEQSPEEKLRKEVKNLNQPSTLETILNKRKAAKKHEEKKVEKKEEVEEEFEGLPKEPPVEKPVEKPKEEVKTLPTRNEVIEYAKTKMNIVVDEKTEKKFKAMKLADLMKEVQYE